MILCKPDQIEFETYNDYIDYVSKGFTPRKKNFNKMCEYLSTEVVSIDTEQFIEGLTRVYENNRRKRNIILATVGVGIVGGLIGSICYQSHIRNREIDMMSEFITKYDRDYQRLLEEACKC